MNVKRVFYFLFIYFCPTEPLALDLIEYDYCIVWLCFGGKEIFSLAYSAILKNTALFELSFIKEQSS